MTAYDFSFVKNTSFAFNGTADSISFGALNAADFTVTVSGGNTTLTHSNGDFVTLTGFDVAGVASGGAAAPNNIANFTFGSGNTQSRLVVGDQTTSTVTDSIANTINLTGTAWVNGNNLVYGLAGDDVITSPGTGNSKFFGGQGGDQINLTTSVGNNTIYGGDGATDSTDGNDSITIAGGANSVYGNAGNDVVTTAVTTTSGVTNTIYLGLGNDQLADGALGHQGNFLVYGNTGDDTILARSAGDVTVFGGNGITDTTDGADTITVGTGSATVYGNSGNDNITQAGITAANKILAIHGGLGNDTVTTGAGVVTARATIHGGSGDDRIDLGANNFAGDVTLYGGNGEADATDGADTILLGSGNASVYGNSGNDVISATVALAANKTANIFTGLGNDTVNISSTHADTAKINVTLADGNEVINYVAAANGYVTTINGFNAANDKFNVTLDGGSAATLVVSNGFIFNDNGTVDGQHTNATEEAFNFTNFTGDFNGTNFVIGDGTSKLITNINGATAAVLTGGTGNDQLIAGNLGDTLTGGTAGADKLVGGNGADVFQLTVAQIQALSAGTGTVQGGAGVDTLEVSNAGAITIDDADFSVNVRSVEVLKLSNAAGHNVTLANTTPGSVGAVAAGITTVNASAVTSGTTTIAATAFAASLTYLGGSAVDAVTRGAAAGSDNIDLGAGDDTFSIDLAALTSADTVKGGTGTDALTISTAGALTDSQFTNVTGFESITLAAGANTLTGGASFDAAGILTVTGNANTDVMNFSTFTKALTLSGAAGADTITGGAGNDTIDGGADADSLVGGAGDDRITTSGGGDTVRGGTGNDTITLGAGVDRVQFENTNNGVDVILNASFAAAQDIFDFKTSPTVFDAAVTETLVANATAAGLAGAVANNGILVLTADAVGNAAALKVLLDAESFDTVNIGNRVIVWEVDATTVGVGVINNTDTVDNNGVTVTQFASLTQFADQAAVSAFTGALAAANFDII